MGRSHAEEMKQRTKDAAVAVIALTAKLKRGVARRVIVDQVVRSATSVGANYRSARRARSRKEFVSKLNIVIEEADETLCWIELAVATGLLDRKDAAPTWRDINELVRILVATVKKAGPPDKG